MWSGLKILGYLLKKRKFGNFAKYYISLSKPAYPSSKL